MFHYTLKKSDLPFGQKLALKWTMYQDSCGSPHNMYLVELETDELDNIKCTMTWKLMAHTSDGLDVMS